MTRKADAENCAAAFLVVTGMMLLQPGYSERFDVDVLTSKAVCLEGYEYCLAESACLSIKTCRLEDSLGSPSCPSGFGLCSDEPAGCWSRSCVDRMEPSCSHTCKLMIDCEPTDDENYVTCKKFEECDRSCAANGEEEEKRESKDVGSVRVEGNVTLQMICPTDYKFCSAEGSCLSTKRCFHPSATTESGCPDDHVVCAGGCFVKNCQVRVKPCPQRCRKFVECSNVSPYGVKCRQWEECSQGCQDETAENLVIAEEYERPRKRAKRRDNFDGRQPVCGKTGEIFCVSSGRCAETCESPESANAVVAVCPRGMSFCLSNGRCSRTCGEEGRHGPGERALSLLCPDPEAPFCVSEGRCSKECGGGDGYGGVSYRPVVLDCPEGSSFCLQEGFCSVDAECSTKDEDVVATVCSEDADFCLADGTCSADCEVLREPDKDVALVCPKDTIFCLADRRCRKQCEAVCPDGGEHCTDTDEQKSTSSECPRGLSFCLASGRCSSDCDDNGQEQPKTHCAQGEVFCVASSKCARFCSPEKEEGPGGTSCPEGTTFCIATETCEENCWDAGELTDLEELLRRRRSGAAGRQPRRLNCPENSGIFCLDSGTCRCEKKKKQQDEDKVLCREGETFCLESGYCGRDCIKRDRQKRPGSKCPSGTLWCLDSGRCERFCGEKEDQPRPPPQQKQKCPPGTTFCLSSGRCSWDCKEVVLQDEVDPAICPKGKVYCISTGECSSICRPDEEDTRLDRPGRACPAGKIFCLSTGDCQDDRGCSTAGRRQRGQRHRCPRGETFCLSSGRCEKSCSDSSRRRRDRTIKCPLGLIYCMAIDACVVGDCSVFEEPPRCGKDQICSGGDAGKCESSGVCQDTQPSFRETCEEGEFCHFYKRCQSTDKKCPESNCKPDQVYCRGECRSSCHVEDVGCPSPSLIPGIHKFSSCAFRQHCGDDFLCCADQGGFRQCISPTLTGIPADEALQRSCQMLAANPNSYSLLESEETCVAPQSLQPDENTVSSGVAAESGPEACRPTSLCCEGICRGFYDGSARPGWTEPSCTGGAIRCDIFDTCVYPADWNSCRPVCKDEDGVMCRDTVTGSPTCQSISACGALLGDIWTPTGSSGLLSGQNSSEFILRDAVPAKDRGRYANDAEFKVTGEAPSIDAWEVKVSGSWRDLKVGDQLTLDDKLRLKGGDGDVGVAGGGKGGGEVAEFNLMETSNPGTVVVVMQIAPLASDAASLRAPGFLTVTSSGYEGLRFSLREDSKEAVILRDVIYVRETAETMISIQERYGQVFRYMSELGLWRFDLSDSSSFAGALANIFAANAGQRTCGVKFEASELIASKKNYTNKLLYSLNGGKTWLVHENPNSALYLVSNDLTRISLDLKPDFVGNVSFKVTPFAVNLDGSKQEAAESTRLDIQIAPVNDPPRPIRSSISSLPSLMVPYDIVNGGNEGFYARDLAHRFYEDDPPLPNERRAGLGLAILSAPGSELGRWQFKSEGLGDASQWYDMTDTTEFGEPPFVIPAMMRTDQTHQGPLAVERNVEKLACEYDGMSDNSDFWREIRRRACPETDDPENMVKTTARKKARRKTGPIHGGSRVSQALDNLDEATNEGVKPKLKRKMLTHPPATQLVNALLLGPTARIRFHPFDPKAAWGIMDAIQFTKLYFMAWDMTDLREEGDVVQVDLPFCQVCKSSGSLSREFSSFYIPKSDCDGTAVVIASSQKKLDQCGVCGGNDACIDCNGTLNGGRVTDCGVCLEDGETVSSLRNCGGTCGDDFYLREDDGECVAATNVSLAVRRLLPTVEPLPCDAVSDECNNCVDGKMAEVIKIKDQCGICRDEAEVAAMTSDEIWGGCDSSKMLMSLSIHIFDKLRSSRLTVDLKKPGFHPSNITNVLCTLLSIDTPGLKVDSVSAKVHPGYITASFVNPYSALYSLNCSVEASTEGIRRNYTSKGSLAVVDSRTILVEEIVKKTNSEDNSIEISVRLSHALVDYAVKGLTCFCRKFGSFKSRPIPSARLDDDDPTLVRCGKLPFQRGGTFECGVVLKPDKKALSMPQLPAKTVTVTAASPKILESHFKEGNMIVIIFDRDVESSSGDCTEIFDQDTIQVIGEESECFVRANRLKVSLGDEYSLSEGDESMTLRFRQSNGIVTKGSESEIKTGAVAVAVVGDKKEFGNKPHVSLVCNNYLCYGSQLRLKAKSLHRFGVPGDRFQWNVTLAGQRDSREENIEPIASGEFVIEGPGDDATEPSGGNRRSGRGRKGKKNKDKRGGGKSKERKKRSKRKIAFNVDTQMLTPDTDYEVHVVGLTGSDGSTDVFTQQFKMAPEQQRLVANIKGPTGAVAADRKLLLTVRSIDCIKERQDNFSSRKAKRETRWKRQAEEGFTYFWSTDGPVSVDLSSKKTHQLTLGPGSLQGGTRYLFAVHLVPAIDGGADVIATKDIDLASKGVLAELPAREISVAVNKALILDGALARDKDFRPGDLKYDWSCVYENSKPCYVLGDLEQGLLKERFSDEMSNVRPVIPPDVLQPGNYNFTLCVYKDGDSSCKSLLVTMRQGKVVTFQLAAREVVVDPSRELIIKALVDNPADACVSWQTEIAEGLTDIDLEKYTKSAELTCFPPDTNKQKGFHLVLPAGVLEPGAKYGFRISGTSPRGFSSAVVEITTMLMPEVGTCEVSPLHDGIAMNTSYTLSCDGFSPVYDDDLTYTFRFVIDGRGKRELFLASAEGGNVVEVKDVLLPPGVVRLSAQACNNYDSCVEAKFDKKVAVNVGADLDNDAIKNFGISSANLLARKELLSALSLSLRQTATVAAFPESELWAKMGPPLCTLFGNICNDVLDLLTANMSHSDFPTVIEAMNLCVNSECHILKASEAGDTAMAVLNSARAGTNQRLAAILTQMQAIARESQGTAGTQPGEFREPRNKRSPQDYLKKKLSHLRNRMKREEFGSYQGQGLNTILQFVVSLFDLSQLEALLDIAIQTLKDLAEGEQQEGKRTFLDQVDETLRGVCVGTTAQSEPKRLSTDAINITVRRMAFLEDADRSVQLDSNTYISLGNSLPERYREWNCSSFGDVAWGDLICDGLCFSWSVLSEDYLSGTSSKFKLRVNSSALVSPVMNIAFQHPLSGDQLTTAMQERPLESRIRIISKITEIPQGVRIAEYRRKRAAADDPVSLRCFLWLNAEEDWSDEPCDTEGIHLHTDGSMSAECACDKTGYVGVFVVGSGGSLRRMDRRIFERTMRFKIHEDFNTIVTDMDSFKLHLRKQLANEYLSTTIHNIEDMTVEPGSIVVTFQLVGFDDDEAAELGQAYDTLASLFEEGHVRLLDESGQEMTIPPQCVKSECGKLVTEDDKLVTYILIGVACFVVVAIITFIAIAICVKTRKNKAKLFTPLMGSRSTTSVVPTYRSVQFADSLEGSKATLAKAKSKSSSSSSEVFLPSPTNYDSITRGQSRGMVRLEEEDEGGVPLDPATYRKPSREELEQTRPIPEDVIRRHEERLTLPGTPEHDY